MLGALACGRTSVGEPCETDDAPCGAVDSDGDGAGGRGSSMNSSSGGTGQVSGGGRRNDAPDLCAHSGCGTGEASCSGTPEILGNPGGDGDSYFHAVSSGSSGAFVIGGSNAGVLDSVAAAPLSNLKSYGDGVVAFFELPSRWVKVWSGTWVHVVNAVALDLAGDVVAAGSGIGPTDFGDGELLDHQGQGNALIAKYDASGQLLWGKVVGDPTAEVARDVAVAADGSIVVVGESSDVFVVKLTSAGDEIWSRTIASEFFVSASSVALAPDGSVVVAGGFHDEVDFGGEAVDDGNFEDIYVAKYTPDGDLTFAAGFGGDKSDAVRSIAVDSLGNIVLVGDFEDEIDFGAGPMTSKGMKDVFVAKLDPAGNLLWAEQYGDEDYQSVWDATLDGYDDLVIAARWDPQGDTDRVFKVDDCGVLVWEWRVNTIVTTALGASADGTLVMAGTYEGSFAFDGALPVNAVGSGTETFYARLER